MARFITGSCLQTDFSMKVIKTSQRHIRIQKALYSGHPQGQIKLNIENDKDTEKLPQTKA